MSGALMPPPGGPPGPPQAPGAPPGMMLNPAFVQWMQLQKQQQAVMAQNAQLQKQFADAVALIKKDGMHGFRLDIEADSTIAPDEQAEKAARVEFMQQFIPLMQQVVPIAQGNPPLASLAKEITLFAVRGFNVARPIEEAVEKAFDAIAGMPPHPSNQPPPKGGTQQNPQVEMAKTQADVHDTDTKAQVQMMQIAQKQQQANAQLQVEMARDAAEDQRSRAQMAMSAVELEQRSRMEAARVERMGMQNIRGLP